MNLANIAAVGFVGFYILLEPVAGAMFTPLLFASNAYSKYLVSTYGATANYGALAVFLASWIAQFIGHGVFEGRSPALLDNLLQALVLAPFFVFIELLFMFGYRPELQSRLNKAIQMEVDRFRSSKAKVTTNGHGNGKAT